MPSSGRWMALFAGGFRRLRAASYFARGGSSSQSPLDSVSAWWRKLRSFPCSSSSRRTHFVGLRREVRERLPKTPPGTAQGGHSVPTFAFPRTPVTGVTPWSRQNPSGAQNLSECLNSRRATGPWVCGKLRLMRFHNRAWVCRANMPGSTHGIPHPPPSGAPSPKGEGFGRPIPLPSPLGEGGTRSVTDEAGAPRGSPAQTGNRAFLW